MNNYIFSIKNKTKNLYFNINSKSIFLSVGLSNSKLLDPAIISYIAEIIILYSNIFKLGVFSIVITSIPKRKPRGLIHETRELTGKFIFYNIFYYTV